MSILRKIYPLVLLLIFIIICVIRSHENNVKTKNIIFSDQEGYYMYLPALFIYGGFDQYPIRTKEQFGYYQNTKKVFTKYTCGVALLQMPFFLIAHAFCKFSGAPADGFSPIYMSLLDFSTILYIALAFIFLFLTLKNQFQKPVLLIAFFCFFFGSNLYYYTVIDGLMSHAYSFFLIATLLYFTPRFYDNPNYRNCVFLGLLIGFIILCRPSNIIVLLYFILYNVSNRKSMIERMLFYRKNAPKVIVSALCTFLVFVPQFIYWFHLSGNFILYSYENEGFIYWKSPKIGKVLFGVWNGWILYTPMILFALIGLYAAIKHKVKNAISTLIIFLAATYLFGSWWAWWFGGAYGHRCYIDLYPLLIPFFCIFLQKISELSVRKRMLMGGLFLLIVFHNLRMIDLYTKTKPWDGAAFTVNTYLLLQKRIFLPFL